MIPNKKIVVIHYNFYAGSMASTRYTSKHLRYRNKTES